MGRPDQDVESVSSTSSWATNGNLTGKYVNTLGSTLVMTCTGSSSSARLTGYYISAVGNAEGSYSLYGAATSCGNDGQGGFVVAWNNEQNGNSFSSTSWTFQASQDHSYLYLTAPWQLVRETTEEDSWAANLFGIDIFTKQNDDGNGNLTERTTPPTIPE